MEEELSLQKKQQLAALNMMSDWSKWLITLETGGIAGVFSIIKFTDYTATIKGPWSLAISFFLIVTALCFLFSILNACCLLCSLPDIVESLHKSDSPPENEKFGNKIKRFLYDKIDKIQSSEDSINNMRSPYFIFRLYVYQTWQYISFLTGLACITFSLILWTVWVSMTSIQTIRSQSVKPAIHSKPVSGITNATNHAPQPKS